MKQLLEAINRGILRGLNENNIELLADLDDDHLNLLDSILTKAVNNQYNAISCQLQSAIRTGNISSELKLVINNPANFYKFKGLIKANDKEHLKELILIGQELLESDGNFNWIDTSEITDMSELFASNHSFNGHIELWDVSNVITMESMFNKAKSFNLPIGNWDVSNVTNMKYLFWGANEFNLPIGNWDVSNITDMSLMFGAAYAFNQPLNNWDVSNVTCMDRMFTNAEAFNQDISKWDVSNVKNMDFMFYNARAFNQPLNKWNVKHVNINAIIFRGCPIKEEYKPHR